MPKRTVGNYAEYETSFTKLVFTDLIETVYMCVFNRKSLIVKFLFLQESREMIDLRNILQFNSLLISTY